MPKVTAPLMSLQASGEIGMPLQYSTHRGLSIVRKKPVHQDPSTPAQQQARANFLLVSDFWSARADFGTMRFDWNNLSYFSKRKRNGWNEFCSAGISALRDPGQKKFSIGDSILQPRYLYAVINDLRGDNYNFEPGEFFFDYSTSPRGPFFRVPCLQGRVEVEVVWPTAKFSVGEQIAGSIWHRTDDGVLSRRSGLIKFVVEEE
jgi:hypothetical protein